MDECVDMQKRVLSAGLAAVLFGAWVGPGVLRAEEPDRPDPGPEAESETPRSSRDDETQTDVESPDATNGDSADTSPGAPNPSAESSSETDQSEADPTGSDREGSLLKRVDALEAAVENNHDVEISRTESEIAARNVSLGNAGFLPRVEALGSQTHLFGGSGLFGQGQFFTQTSLGIEANWLLFGGLGRFSRYDRLKIERSVQEIERRARVERTIGEVAIAYYDVVRQRELLEAFRETREVSEERVTIARSRLQAGTGTKVDVNLAAVELNQDRSAVENQRIAVTRSKTALNRLMGRHADREFRVRTEIEVTPGLEYDAVQARALDGNRRLRATRRRREVASERVEERRAERWPEVQLSLGYNYTEFHNGLAPQFDVPAGLEYGVNVTVPIFDGFNVLRRIDNAESERTIRDTEVRREETRIRKAVRDAHSEYRRHLQRIEFARESVELADENVEVALTELEAGTLTQVELRQVQLNLQDARTRLIDAKYKAKRAELRLRRLAGDLYGTYVE